MTVTFSFCTRSMTLSIVLALTKLPVVLLWGDPQGLSYPQPLYKINLIAPGTYIFPRSTSAGSIPHIQPLKQATNLTLHNPSAGLSRLHAQPQLRSATISQERQPIIQPSRSLWGISCADKIEKSMPRLLLRLLRLISISTAERVGMWRWRMGNVQGAGGVRRG